MSNQVSKYYFDNPEVWEQVNEHRFDRECAFLLDIFQAHGKVSRLLDVGCGTGAHLARLSRFQITGIGIDLNENMVRFARSRFPELHFEVLDMRKLEFTNEFDAVICLCTVFCYNTTNEDIDSSLQSFHRALKANGILIIDVFNPISFLEKRQLLKEIKEEERYKPLGLYSVNEHTVDENRQLMIERRSVFQLETNSKIRTDMTEYRLFFPQEFRYFLERNGFRHVDFFGGFEKDHKALSGGRLITVSIKG